MHTKCSICKEYLTADIPDMFVVEYVRNGSIKHIQHYYCEKCSKKIIPRIEESVQKVIKAEEVMRP